MSTSQTASRSDASVIASTLDGSVLVPDGNTIIHSDANDVSPPDGGPEVSPHSLDLPDSVDIGSWNIEWFGSNTQGPSDETLQQANVKSVLEQLNLDLVGLVEVVDTDSFARMTAALPAYNSLLVTDPTVENGSAYYRANEQKVALLYKKRFQVTAARVVATDASLAFAGRPPMAVELSFEENGQPRTLVVVVAHFKAMADQDGWTRRTEASAAYKSWLDATYPYKWVLTIGDFNDDIDMSTYQRKASPFANFVADTQSYQFSTASLTAQNVSTTTSFSATIDHHLATDELWSRYVPESATVVRVDEFVPDYKDTTSDHYPVVTRYDLR